MVADPGGEKADPAEIDAEDGGLAGAEEPGDRTLFATAVRETGEELAIAPSDIVALGALSPIVTVTNFYVEPFVAAIPQPYVFRPQEAEIAERIDAAPLTPFRLYPILQTTRPPSW